MKYHVNPKTGRAGQCKATKKGCPLGAETPHFESKEEAHAFIEKSEAIKNSGRKTESLRKPIETKEIEKVFTVDSSCYQDGDYQKLEEYMKGKSISKPDELLERKIKNSYTSSYTDCEVLLLSDGSAMVIEANDGCGACPSGNFMVDFAREYPHEITKLSYKDYSLEGEDNYGEDDETVEEIIAYSQKNRRGTPIIRVSGTVGNGYYGEGYELTLVPAKDVKELDAEPLKRY